MKVSGFGSAVFVVAAAFCTLCASQELPTWYQYYTEGGIQSGLATDGPDGLFLLNGKPFRLMSGAVHYFRVHPDYWRDRLRKLRAAGLNTVETYVPWNLHEPERGVFDFGQGGNDMSALLDVESYIRIAQEEDLFVIVRPGPYICAEWEFGGLPSWLLRDPEMQLRTSDPKFLQVVDEYFDQLIPKFSQLTFSDGKGPIIAFQVENEYGHYGVGNASRDTQYLIHLKERMESLGANELFFTSDTPSQTADWGAIPGVLQTANFKRNPDQEFDILEELQPGMPKVVAEYWTGWFDHWLEPVHEASSPQEFAEVLERIFLRNGSVNFYMFHGGTSFGFLNGANILPIFPSYVADVSSYDYDAPLSEAGDYTEKYHLARELLQKYSPVQVSTPELPPVSSKKAYGTVNTTEYLTLEDLLLQVPPELIVTSSDLVAMEDLPINNNNGQSYGYIVYRHVPFLSSGWHNLTTIGHVRDLTVALLNQQRISEAFESVLQLNNFGYWSLANRTLDFEVLIDESQTLDLVVENMGRNNFGPPSYFKQKKGLPEGPVLLDDEQLLDWTIYPLEFKGPWVRSLTGWRSLSSASQPNAGPGLYKASLEITGLPEDTFISFYSWGRGVVFINGFNIGRFSSVGPTRTLYVPAPLLKTGQNTILVFDLFEEVTSIEFVDKPDLGPTLGGDGNTTETPVVY